MLVYHGTTRRSARQIRREGFRPRGHTRRVWFARSYHYARQRAKHKASRGGDQPIVLACNLDLQALQERLGGGRVFHRGSIISVRGPVPASVLCPHRRDGGPLPFLYDIPDEAFGLARWVNRLLHLRPHKGVSRRHPGIQRLVTWVRNRVAVNPSARVNQQELLAVAAQWLPEFFDGVQIDYEHLRTLRVRGPRLDEDDFDDGAGELHTVADDDETDEGDRREDEALNCLLSPKPRRRVRGLGLLAQLQVPDLFDWCTMFLDDDDESVAVAALEALADCDDVNPFIVEDLAEATERRLRAAALEVLARHDEDDRARWVWAGVTDPEPHVRLALVRHLDHLDPAVHEDVFQAAVNDPNPEIARLARRLTEGRGLSKLAW